MSNATPPRPAPPCPGPPAGDQPAEQPAPHPVAELAELDTLADRPLAEHVTVLDAVHRALAAQLSSAES